MKIRAAVVYKPNDPYIIEEVYLAPPKRDEVLVKITASGVCHTDYVFGAGFVLPIHPVVLGHEGAGIVCEVGDGVSEFKPGDRVCMSISFCNECYSCKTGRPYECEKNELLNFGGCSYDGTRRLSKDGTPLNNFFNQSSFASYSVTHKNNLVLVPEEMDLRLTCPLGCGIQTGAGAVLNCLKPEPGSSIVVAGCGGVGMSAIMAAKLSGCTTIIAVDTFDSRLELSKEMGATHVINASKTDPVSAAKELTSGRGANYAVNASGNMEASRTAIDCTDLFGNIAVIGGEGTFGRLNARVIRGVTEGFSIPSIFIPQLIDYYLAGKFPFDKMVEFYAFEDINKASADSLSGKTIKPILLMD